MNLKVQRRLAAEVLGVGEKRVWINPEKISEVSTAITREEIRKFIEEGVIKAKPEMGVSRGRWRLIKKQRRKGLRKGPGSRKGPVESEDWIYRVRAMRRFLRLLKKRKIITPKVYRMLYMKVKSGTFHDRRQLKAYIEEHGLARR
ncbi:MAG: 50S ribosomal protein L19e [Candidatus Methanomethyliaceae archaeon]|nr:50S ribosomal protein L19e [Candidatus Methanomethyliaceae archaeon]MDW7970355.1 50S ribosomal protein L19e [Nitrososphaerota archaeon]